MSSPSSTKRIQDMDRNTSILPNMLALVGNTPLVRINRIGSELPCEFCAKLEFFNPGGSIKDRIALEMIEGAEEAKTISPGKSTLIEATSGNTGLGIALCGAVKGYKTVITMPEKMSQEKSDTLAALGATIVRTPTEADSPDDPRSHISVAAKLEKDTEGGFIPDQYNNPNNPNAHHRTAEEIIRQTGGKIDMLVCGAGTGGSITGIAQILKKKVPNCKIIGVDPYGSILAGPDTMKSYQVEGIGYSFIPNVLDRSLIDSWVKTDDQNSFTMARRIIAEEGILAGGSSGSVMWAAIEAAKKYKLGKDARVVVIFADSIRNYMSKFLRDSWLEEFGFKSKSPSTSTST